MGGKAIAGNWLAVPKETTPIGKRRQSERCADRHSSAARDLPDQRRRTRIIRTIEDFAPARPATNGVGSLGPVDLHRLQETLESWQKMS